MLEIAAILIALVSLGITLILAGRVIRLERGAGGRALETVSWRQSLPPSGNSPRPLIGLRIGLSVKQDYAHPIFERLVKELLLSEDVAEVTILTPAGADDLRANWNEGPDLLIAGEVIGNGYAEVYYNADFTCYTAQQAICTVVERPPNGDRPNNLALELVTRLKTELEKHLSRDERRQAIRELHVD